MQYRITARVSNRPNGGWRYRTDVSTFLLDNTIQGIVSAEHAAQIAHSLIADLVRQDLSAGAEIHVEATDEHGNDYFAI